MRTTYTIKVYDSEYKKFRIALEDLDIIDSNRYTKWLEAKGYRVLIESHLHFFDMHSTQEQDVLVTSVLAH